MRKFSFYLELILGCIVSVQLAAQDVAFQRGVNLTGWFQAGSAQQIHFSQYTRQDFEQIQRLGCDVIRLPINLHFMTNGAPNYKVDPLFYKFLDQVIDWAEELKIHLIIDNHTFDTEESTDPNVGIVLEKVWTQLATRYQNRSELIYYEILNEPHGISDEAWNAIQTEVVRTIREVDTKHTLIVGPAGWNSFYNLDAMPVYEDDNLIYTFHLYDPFIFTHQGASWVNPSMEPLRDVPFPFQVSKMPEFPSSLVGTWIEQNFDNYAQVGNVAHVKSLIDIAARFSEARQVPVFCGEFGVYIPNSDDSSRVLWYESVRQALEESNIPWTIWDYHGGFGLFEQGGNGLFEHDLNIPLLKALDFTVPPQSDYVLQPDSTGFLVYTDYVGEQILLSSFTEGEMNLYSEELPNNGMYSLYWMGAEQYNTISFDFIPNKDLSRLVEQGYALNFMVRSTEPELKFDIRWVDTNESGEDLPWRMGVTIDASLAPFDHYWHSVHIPLKDFSEQGAWDGEWHDPEGKFDWAAVDRLEIVAERQNFGAAKVWFDNIHTTNADTSQIYEKTAFVDVITATSDLKEQREEIKVYPNPTDEFLTIRSSLTKQFYYQLLDASGRIVQRESFTQGTELNISSLSKGVYYLQLYDEAGMKSVRKISVE